ncbi:MAG: N-acetylneuraminate synthase family protein [Planctomycetaceae bacterium]
MTEFQIGPWTVGAGHPVFCIAEVGLAHEGSLGAAHAYINAAAATGVAAVKFQTHLAEHESSDAEKFRLKVFPQDATRFEYWQRTGFEKSQWLELAAHAREAGLLFLSSPFSEEAVDWLIECDVPAWKVASGELTNHPMIRKMAQTGKPILISSGLSNWHELDETIQVARDENAAVGVFQCTTSYPCPPEQWGLNVLAEMRSRYGCPVGLSDHSGTIVPGIAAVALGASMLEFHVAFSKSQFGPDSQASLTFEQTAELVAAVKQLDVAQRHPIKKDEQAENLSHLHRLFTKSITAARSLAAGHQIGRNDLAFKKPGTGISAKCLDAVVGKRLRIAVPADHFFSESDFS